jgi:hypothetical protein
VAAAVGTASGQKPTSRQQCAHHGFTILESGTTCRRSCELAFKRNGLLSISIVTFAFALQTVLDLSVCGIDLSLDDSSSATVQALGRILASPMLRSLDLSGNAIGGALSPRLFPNASASGLESLNLGANRIGGSVPVEWCTQLVNLRSLYLNDNALSGTFPAPAFTTLVQLRVRHACRELFGSRDALSW